MNSVMRFIVWGVMPLGSLLGGALATWFGLRDAIWVGAVGMSLAVLPVLLSPVRTLREMPEPVEDEPLPVGGRLRRRARRRQAGGSRRRRAASERRS